MSGSTIARRSEQKISRHSHEMNGDEDEAGKATGTARSTLSRAGKLLQGLRVYNRHRAVTDIGVEP